MDPWAPGTRIGELTVERRLGAGGMGEVYLGLDANGARFAIKTLALGASTDERLRFQREGQAQASVKPHANLARVHRFEQGPSGPCLVMEYVSGGTLSERLRQGPLPVDEAVDVVVSLAAGLEHLHKAGVLHRDIKPANVIFNAEGVPKLVDFGLARVAGADALTQTGVILGTPAYMSPEQAEGARGGVDERSDVYGLAAVLYHCLTGRPPFLGSSAVQILAQLTRSDPPSPRSLRPEVTPPLNDACMRALACAPAERTPSAAELARELETQPAPAPGKGWLALALLLSVGVGLAALSWLSPPKPSVPASVTEPAPAPRPAPVWKPELSWRLPAGEELRGTIDLWSKTSLAGATSFELTYEYRFHLVVEESTAEVIRMRARLEALRFVRSFPPFEYPLPGGGPHPLDAAVGNGFTFSFDPDTGRVLDVTGCDAITRAVDTRARGISNNELGAVANFAQPAQVQEMLNKLLFFLPNDADERAGRWQVTEQPAPQGIWQMPLVAWGNNQRQQGGEPPSLRVEDVLLTADAQVAPGPEHQLSWKGTRTVRVLPRLDWERRLDAVASFKGGRLRSIDIDEAIDAEETESRTKASMHIEPLAPEPDGGGG